jgi:hypothetical protein
MLAEIIEVPASEKYLKIFFFQMRLEAYNIDFDEPKIQSIIKSKKFDDIKSTELYELSKIPRRWAEDELTSYLPDKFFYIKSKEEVFDQTIFSHPTLYTKINSLVDHSIYEAQLMFNCHLLNKNGDKIYILEDFQSKAGKDYVIEPNLYDDGGYYFNVYSDEFIVLCTYDDNNGEWYELFQFKNDSYLINIETINDKELFLSLVKNKEDLDIIEFASKNLRNDFDLMSICIGIDSSLLLYASEELQNNFNLVFQAVSKDGTSLKFASDELKNNKTIVLSAIKEDPHSLKYASENLKNDKEVALAAINSDHKTFKYLGQAIKDDPEIKAKLPIVESAKTSGNSSILKLGGDKINKPVEDPDLPF